jgi:hypothetical protein
MKKLRALALLLMPFSVLAQSNVTGSRPICGYELLWKNLEQRIPDFRVKYDAYFKEQSNVQAKPTGTEYEIPVVFHVVYYQNGAAIKGNLHDSILLNQLAVLNDAFRKTHSDTGNLRAIFKPLSADAEIQFHLATVDPDGNPTSGITRTATNIRYFGDWSLMMGELTSIERIKKTAEGGKDPWDTRRYLNIWISDMSIDQGGGVVMPTVIGLATPPLNPPPPNWDPDDILRLNELTDGILLQFQAVGSNNPYIAELSSLNMGNKGRTAVHEVGHYLGLRHIWGDAYAGEACTVQGDDGIGDTPAQANGTSIALNPPSAVQNTCDSGTANDLPDLWENYMDYTKDSFLSMFTQGQVAFMRGVCANQRDSLFWDDTVDIGKPKDESILQVYPQPATQYLNVKFPGKIDQIRIINTLGQTILHIKDPGVSTNKIDVNMVAPGNYYLQIIGSGNSYTRKIVILR